MMDNTIKLNKSDVLTLKIRTAEGKLTGEVLTFDLEDVDSIVRLNSPFLIIIIKIPKPYSL